MFNLLIIKKLKNVSQNDKTGSPAQLSSQEIQWIVREARKQSGIPKEITAHILRHTYATYLLEMGLDIMSVKDLLGHADIQTTLIYLHSLSRSLSEWHNREDKSRSVRWTGSMANRDVLSRS
ncbi:tyrosine-type recombinase/integrase [Aequorivita ciconiae]|uniref:tyrosine-type recombinase/integrase n=1 Tax=Aequorivita ciconiae TaxID=2494375 RepID=UPI0029392CF2|nr:tyrosine-type recombinase/integrase [Aequorivita sp. H23M31]